MNHVHRTLLGNKFELGVEGWPEGTPVMCGENQPELGVSNGDIGLIIGNGKNRRLFFRIYSEEEQLSSKLIHPARLSLVAPALAMTIHKAQGSEAKKVILLWPETTSNPLNDSSKINKNFSNEKSLLYTAITRAKEVLNIYIPTT